MPSVAVIGASSAPHKFGNKAVRAYLRQGWTVYPVNPNERDRSRACRATRRSSAIPRARRSRVTLYVPPVDRHSRCSTRSRPRASDELFVNPGAESDELIARAEALGLDPIQACSIVDIGERP